MSSEQLSIKVEKPAALKLTDLRARLETVDSTSFADLLALKNSLQELVANGPQSPTATIPAHKLTRREIFTWFKLANKETTIYGLRDYDIPRFELAAEFAASEAEPSEWLRTSLNLCGKVFQRNNEADVRTFINLIVMDVLRNVQGFQDHGIIPKTCATECPSTPKSMAPLLAFNEVQIADTVLYNGRPIEILGRFDIGFGHSNSSLRNSNANLDTYLAVLATKCAGTAFELGFNQLLVYLAIIQKTRSRKLPIYLDAVPNRTVYGLLSDGQYFIFVCLDNDGMVYRTQQFNSREDMATILRYFRFCLSVVTVSSPTSSPSTIRLEYPSEESFSVWDHTGFVGLQERVFKFEAVEVDEWDTIAPPWSSSGNVGEI